MQTCICCYKLTTQNITDQQQQNILSDWKTHYF